MQPQSSTSTGPTCPSTTTCEPSRQHTHTHTQDFSVDLICGGFPCQDISVAGKGAGLAGERSGLWHDFARVIRTVRPRWVVIENVPALTARGLGTVLGDLAEIGFDAEWHCIPACAVGAPHRRERIWIVGNTQRNRWAARGNNYGRHDRHQPHANGQHAAQVADAKCKRREAESDCLQYSQASSDWEADFTGGCCQVFADANGSGRKQQRRPESVRAEQPAIERSGWWKSEPNVGRVAHGVPSRVDRLRCLGNAVVPQVVEVIGRAILEAEARMTA